VVRLILVLVSCSVVAYRGWRQGVEIYQNKPANLHFAPAKFPQNGRFPALEFVFLFVGIFPSRRKFSDTLKFKGTVAPQLQCCKF